MGMTHEQMDRMVNEHFSYEAADDVDGVMGTLTDAPEHEVIPSPVGALTDKAQMREFYEMLFSSVSGERVEPLRRLYGDNFVIDETMWHGHFSDGRPFLCEGRSGPVSFRLLHIFEFLDGGIGREQVWCDLAAIQRQLGVAVG